MRNTIRSFLKSTAEMAAHPCRRGVVSVGLLNPYSEWMHNVRAVNGRVDGASCTTDPAQGCTQCAHAEASLVHRLRTEPEWVLYLRQHRPILVTSLSPCAACARSILLDSPVWFAGVVYAERYRDPSGISLLRAGGMPVWSLDEFCL